MKKKKKTPYLNQLPWNRVLTGWISFEIILQRVGGLLSTFSVLHIKIQFQTSPQCFKGNVWGCEGWPLSSDIQPELLLILMHTIIPVEILQVRPKKQISPKADPSTTANVLYLVLHLSEATPNVFLFTVQIFLRESYHAANEGEKHGSTYIHTSTGKTGRGCGRCFVLLDYHCCSPWN